MTILKSTCLLILPAAITICAGQSPGQGSISGKILTAAGNGAAVPGAPVQATNLDTKETYKATSVSDGGYKLTGLPAGNYEISIERVFLFQPFHQSGVRVGGGETTLLDIRLDDLNLGTLGDSGVEFVQALGDKPVPTVLPRARVTANPILAACGTRCSRSRLGPSRSRCLQRKRPTCNGGALPLACQVAFRLRFSSSTGSSKRPP